MSFPRQLLVALLALALPSALFGQTSARAPRSAKPQVRQASAPAARPTRTHVDSQVHPTSHVVEEPFYEEQPFVEDMVGDCCPGGACGPNWFVRGEYLMWWTNGASSPPLVTTSPAGTAQANAGVLGRSGTSVLFGDETLDSDILHGGRITIGGWADACRSHGWEVNYLILGEDTQGYAANANNASIIARPFFNAQTGLQDSRLIVFPGLVTGSVGVESTTDFQALEVLFRGCLFENPCGRTDYVFGYRYADLGDTLRITESTTSLSGVTAGTRFDLYDDFTTRNVFHGLEIGLISEQQFGPCWSLEVMAKLAFGSTNASGTVTGERITTNGLGTAVTPSGLLALGTNNGDHSENRFSFLPELGVKLHYNLNCRWKASAGYNLLVLTDVVRAGDQIDTTINPTQIPPSVLSGTARPLFPFAGSDFVAQGFSLGLECKF